VLEAAARVRVLATSRVALRLSGEHEYPVPPLQVPAAAEERFEELVANEAVRLFAARARAVDPSFALTSDNLGSVVAVCRRLDGLPLALELAAAWAKVLPVADLERRLGRALDLLVQGARDRPLRQQTLRATLDWSHDLLDERERQVLAELSAFVGDWTLEDAEAVIGDDAVAVLSSLVEHSLVRRRGARFSMLETIREYAVERLAESGAAEDVRRRHASYFVEVAGRVRQAMVEAGEAETAAFALLDIEIDNVRATLDFLHESGEPELESRVAVALRWYWIVRGPATEAIRIFERIVSVSAGLPRPHADALSGAGIFNYRRGERARATEQLEAARAIYHRLGDEDEVGRCVAELGAIAVDDQDFARAAELFEDAVAAFERSENAYRLGVALSNLAAVATMCGRHEEAAEHTRRAIAMQRETNDRGGLGVSLANLGRAQLLTGTDEESARASLREAFDLALELDYRMLIAHLIGDAARLAGDREESARLVGAAIGLFAQIDMAVTPEEVAEHERTLEPVRAALGDERTEDLIRQGREMPADPAIARARAII
jgi:predicted ATPase